jgi:hypothetical protein
MFKTAETYRGIEIRMQTLTYTDAKLYSVLGSPWKFSSLESARKYVRTNKWAAARYASLKNGPALCGQPSNCTHGA